MQPDRQGDAGDQAGGDAGLISAHGAGDPHAFARLYDRYDRPCFRFIRRTLGPAHADAAEDLHQETWIAVSRNAAAFDPARASFQAWAAAHDRLQQGHFVWDHLRRQKIAVLSSATEDEATAIADAGPTPLQQVESRELAQRLVSAVEALPLEQRGAFVMFAGGGLSLAEIAHASGVGVETAKSRLRYARATLRRVLAGERAPPERSAHV